MSATHTKHQAAKDIMSPEPVCVYLGMTIRDVVRVFEANEISGAPVVDGVGRLVGVVSRTDLVRRYSIGDFDRDPAMLIELYGGEDGDSDADSLPSQLITIDDFMTPDPITARPKTSVADLAHRMVDARVHRIIIVDSENIPVGIITSLDLVKALSAPLTAH